MDLGTQNRRFGEIGNMSATELQRRTIQAQIDESKSIDERRKFGQFSTPYPLAKEIMDYGLKLQGCRELHFLEPAVGTGAFFSALSESLDGRNERLLVKSTGIELDDDYFRAAKSIWRNRTIVHNDFTKLRPTETFNFVISNPPYVRHHLIPSERKIMLAQQVESELKIKTSGLMGLYGYFLLLSHKWLAEKAVSGWLIPSEFMDVNYGSALKKYLLEKVRLFRIHRYSPAESKFEDALVSSCVVWFVNEKLDEDYEVEFSFGGTLEHPRISKMVKKSQLERETKWTRFPERESRLTNDSTATLGDFFDIKRGIATGDNDFFILTKADILNKGLQLNRTYFQPILPSPRNLKTDKIVSDKNGIPILDTQYFLLNCDSSIADESIRKYLDSGKSTAGAKYICRNRKVWYQQEKRLPSQFLCSYMGRCSSKRAVPFRFILNDSNAIVTNSYLMLYPKKHLQDFLYKKDTNAHLVWNALKQITSSDFSDEQRIYGGNLKKIEPRELARVKCGKLQELICADAFLLRRSQWKLHCE